jgi:outer membrane protein OmpA-like peptidoglycan-associated protein
MKGRFCWAAGFLFCATLVWGQAAQTAAELERILALPAITYGDAARFVLGAAGIAGESDAGAYRFAADNHWLPKKAAAQTPATLGGLSLLIMKAFGLKGGLMYSLFPGPRYAYRELVYRKLITGRAYSGAPVSGERFLRVLGRTLDYAGDALPPEVIPPAAPPPETAPPETPGHDAPAYPPVHAPPVIVPPPPVLPEPPAPPEVQKAPEIPEIPEAPEAPEAPEHAAETLHAEFAPEAAADPGISLIAKGTTRILHVIQFSPDSAELTETEQQKLQSIVAILNEFPNFSVLVEGHTAADGSAESRAALSMDRARTVADYLAGLGCRRRDQITVSSYGARSPLADSSTEAGRALNHRVEVVLTDEGTAADE